MDELIVENEKLVYYVIKKMNLYSQQDDFYDIGIIGLIKAARTYKKEKGCFSSYACKCISNQILIELRKLNNGKRKAILVPLDKQIYDKITLEDTIPSDVNIEEDFIKKEQLKSIYKEINRLKKVDREILIGYFGLDGKKRTQNQLSEQFNLSQPQICRKIKSIVNKLRKKAKYERL